MKTNDRSPDRPSQRKSEGARDQTKERTKSSRSAMARSVFFLSYNLQTEIKRIAYNRYLKDAFLWQIKINHFSWLLETNFVTFDLPDISTVGSPKNFPSFSKLSRFLCTLIFIISPQLRRKCF